MARYYGYPPYVPAATRQANRVRTSLKMKREGRDLSPVKIEGRKIARTFWGQAWCENLESYSDFENRLPRGRTYARNGSVIDLQIETGRVRAMVTGSDLYHVEIHIAPLGQKRWAAIQKQCAGQIDSLVALLQGQLSKSVMRVVTDRKDGMFPAPAEIEMSCTCPDWATMCKHLAAVMYGIGARLDHAPDLLFTLRGVDPQDMITTAMEAPTLGGPTPRKRLNENELADLFGPDIHFDFNFEASTNPPKTVAVETQSKPAASKPATSQPAASKPATSKPAAPSNPVPRETFTACVEQIVNHLYDELSERTVASYLRVYTRIADFVQSSDLPPRDVNAWALAFCEAVDAQTTYGTASDKKMAKTVLRRVESVLTAQCPS